MGDRVLIQLKSGIEFSPVAYGHYSGHSAPEVLRRLQRRMAGRPGDVAYAFARLIQEMVAQHPDGNTGFGAWNADGLLTNDSSHGDAGCVIVDVTEDVHTYACFGGYLEVGPDGRPQVKEGR